MGGRSLYQINNQYYDKNGNIVNNSTFGGSWVDTSAYPFPQPACLDPAALHGCLMDSQIQGEVPKAMHANGWTGVLNHLFFVYTSAGARASVGSLYPATSTFTTTSGSHSSFT